MPLYLHISILYIYYYTSISFYIITNGFGGAEGHVLHLGLAGEQCHQRRVQLSGQHAQHFGVVGVLHALQDHLRAPFSHCLRGF